MTLTFLLLAFNAGIISFLAPCVLPLLPGFLAYLAGTTTNGSDTNKSSVMLHAFLYALGFTSVFAILGVALTTVLEAVAYDVQIWLARIGGLVVIFFGLYLTGILHLPWLERTYRLTHIATHSRYLTSFLFGAAFAAGWTPCAGLALGAILGLATTQPGSAFGLLLAYALGFTLPFLLLSLGLSQAQKILARYAPYVRWLNLLFGIILVIFGFLLFTQMINRFADFRFVVELLGS